MKTKIKVCGITRFEDAMSAIASGVDALGFVFYEHSPRYIEPYAAAKIIQKLPPFVTTVGLFVNAQQSHVDQVVNISGVDVIQLHGDESPSMCNAQEKRVIKAISISAPEDLLRVSDYCCAVLLDAKAPKGVYGGTGKPFDWTLLKNLKHDYPLIIAGGLNINNISNALTLQNWFAVDVSSGVEVSKGIKDSQKMQVFCEKIHEFNCKV